MGLPIFPYVFPFPRCSDPAMSDDTKFEVGDVVMLKSGGPSMTITNIRQNDQTTVVPYHCVWFVGGEVKEGNFPGAALDKSGPS